jgi:hypothetical protein
MPKYKYGIINCSFIDGIPKLSFSWLIYSSIRLLHCLVKTQPKVSLMTSLAFSQFFCSHLKSVDDCLFLAGFHLHEMVSLGSLPGE